jgi:hypothetical protein
VSRDEREWSRLRALPVEAIKAALGVARRDDAFLCPCCGSLFDIHDDALFGVSVRCTNEYCRLGAWAWPEHALAGVRRCKIDEARRQLLNENRERAGERVVASMVGAVVRRREEAWRTSA